MRLDVYRKVKERAGQLRFGRSAYVFAVCARDAVRYKPSQDYELYEERFTTHPDPYGYESRPYERGRFEQSAAMLDAVRGEGKFARALEVGSHEGAFTEFLFPRCESIVATEQSPVMLERTAQRCRDQDHVQVRRWNLCVDTLPGTFDLVVLMDVLECIHRPGVLRGVRDKMVAAMEPGGHLLVTNSTLNQELENASWARLFRRGGRRINDFVAQHPHLRVLQDLDEHGHALTMFRKALP